MSGDPGPTRGWPDSPWLAVCEFAIVALLFVLDLHHHVFLTKILFLFPLAWASLRLRGLRWKDMGLVRFHSWGRTLALGVLCGTGIELLELFVSQPLLEKMTGKAPNLSPFLAMRGNVRTGILLLAFVWIFAAFGEEMIYRGYLMNRVAALLRNSRVAWIVSLIVVSMVFGAAHIGQGITGQLENVLDGMLLGLAYLAGGRNLAIPIVAHGVTDTVDLLLIFLGKYPGMQ